MSTLPEGASASIAELPKKQKSGSVPAEAGRPGIEKRGGREKKDCLRGRSKTITRGHSPPVRPKRREQLKTTRSGESRRPWQSDRRLFKSRVYVSIFRPRGKKPRASPSSWQFREKAPSADAYAIPSEEGAERRDDERGREEEVVTRLGQSGAPKRTYPTEGRQKGVSKEPMGLTEPSQEFRERDYYRGTKKGK